MDGNAPDLFLSHWTDEVPANDAAGAAVLLVLRARKGDVEALLIERVDHPADRAAGQVALPGGRAQAEDQDLRSTALREAREEVGILGEDLEAPPRFIEVREAPVFGLRVAVFAAALASRARPPSVGDPHEVASVFWLPCAALTRITETVRKTASGTQRVEAVIHEDHVVWGFTLRVVGNFFSRGTAARQSS